MAAGKKASLSKLDLEDSSASIFVLSEFEVGGTLTLRASDGANCWEGSIKKDELLSLAKRSKMDVQVYTTETWKALSRQDLGDLSFLYSMKKKDKNKIQLVWKKHIFSDNIKFQLGEVTLTAVQNGDIHSLLNFAVSSINELRENNDHLHMNCDRLSKERQETLQDLQHCVDIQDKIEKDLFSKFKLVLNEKKAKIRALIKSQEALASDNEDLRLKLSNSASIESVSGSIAAGSPTNSGGVDSGTIHEVSSKRRRVNNRDQQDTGGSGAITSLLQDVPCRAPSPPPAKRRRHGNAQKAVPNLERPLAKPRMSSHASTSSTSAGHEEIESEELLDML